MDRHTGGEWLIPAKPEGQPVTKPEHVYCFNQSSIHDSFSKFFDTWWRHQMETVSALLAICAGNSSVTGEFPAQRQVARSFDVFFSWINGWVNADQRKYQSSASLAFVRGIHRSPVNSPHKWPVTRKMFPFNCVILSPERISRKTSKLYESRLVLVPTRSGGPILCAKSPLLFLNVLVHAAQCRDIPSLYIITDQLHVLHTKVRFLIQQPQPTICFTQSLRTKWSKFEDITFILVSLSELFLSKKTSLKWVILYSATN